MIQLYLYRPDQVVQLNSCFEPAGHHSALLSRFRYSRKDFEVLLPSDRPATTKEYAVLEGRPTRRAVDGWDSPRFLGFFSTSVGSRLGALFSPAAADASR